MYNKQIYETVKSKLRNNTYVMSCYLTQNDLYYDMKSHLGLLVGELEKCCAEIAEKEELIKQAYGYGTDINNNENGWKEFGEVSVKPIERYDIITAEGSLHRGVYGNQIVDILCGVGTKIIMYRVLFEQ